VPLCVGICISRIGCFLTGLEDHTSGVATSGPWGVNFGDGISRHPTQLYESIFVLTLGVFLLHRMKYPFREGDIFKAFMVAYFTFRLLCDSLKPEFRVFLSMSSIQWACLTIVFYYALDIGRWLRRDGQTELALLRLTARRSRSRGWSIPMLDKRRAQHDCLRGMNCGLQDAFNLAWKLALVHHGAADPVLLDSYEIERRPVAERVMQSGDAFEHAQTITDPAECEKRDQGIRAKLADAKTLHHEVAAETELIADYCESPIVFGDANSKLAAGRRLPDTIPVQRPGMQSHNLHRLGHRAGHTLLLLAGPSAHVPTLVDLHGALQKLTTDSLLFEAAVALGSDTDLPAQIGKFEPGATDLIGVDGITILAVRPDGYIGLRADRDHLKALERYGALIGAGRSSSQTGSSAARSA
jgi:hypothetical protein